MVAYERLALKLCQQDKSRFDIFADPDSSCVVDSDSYRGAPGDQGSESESGCCDQGELRGRTGAANLVTFRKAEFSFQKLNSAFPSRNDSAVFKNSTM